MKQHISSDDLTQLTDKGKKRLREWWKPQVGDIIWCVDDFDVISSLESHKPYDAETDTHGELIPQVINYDDEYDTYWLIEDCIILPSIGQMTEFLSGPYSQINIDVTDMGPMATVNVYYGKEPYADNELCDALWEAVKDILNN